jgi:hypothetical protein
MAAKAKLPRFERPREVVCEKSARSEKSARTV